MWKITRVIGDNQIIIWILVLLWISIRPRVNAVPERAPTREAECTAEHSLLDPFCGQSLGSCALEECSSVFQRFLCFPYAWEQTKTALQWHTDVAIGHLEKWVCFFMMCLRSKGKWLEKVCDKCYLEVGLHYVSWLCKPWVCNWMLFSECSFQQYVRFPPFLLLSYIFLFSTDRQDILQFHFKEKIHPFTLNQSEVCEIIINARSWDKIKCTPSPARSDSVKCSVYKTRA